MDLRTIDDSRIAMSVLDICIRLRETDDFRSAMRDVTNEIRGLCYAEYCCILLVDDTERSCSVLCEAFAKGSHLLPMDSYLDSAFYDITETWRQMLSDSSCIMARNDEDMIQLKEDNPIWYESLTNAHVYNITLFPLKSGNRLIGYMWCLNFEEDIADQIQAVLEVTTFVIGSEIGSHLLLDRMIKVSYDHLTGLQSMSSFFRNAEAARKSMHDRDIESAVVFVNMKGMKYYNKKYGFAEGDVIIKGLGAILSKVFGGANCSRFGKDHFAIYTEVDGLEEKLKKVFDEAKDINAGKSLPVIVGIYPDSMGLVEVALACDRAMMASESGKDDQDSYFVYFDNNMLSRENNHQYIVDNLDRALSENWIKAYYQPIVRATNGLVCDEEALARWIDPQKGMLSPADFIPILEETKLIYKVDLHIVDTVIKRLKRQLRVEFTPVPISVNLSRTDFEVCDIVDEIEKRMEAADVPRHFLTIEITESTLGMSFDYMIEQVDRFRRLGYHVWMDDFGSGYSSLDLLTEIHVDLITFDMIFMRRFDRDPRSKVLLTELMRMMQSLGVETVCEGVESEEQVEFLREIGCTKMQGYYFCKPISMGEIEERYRTGAQIGFENPDEEEYFRQVGAINMYDLSSVYTEETEGIQQYFDTLPMVVFQYDRQGIKIIRCNRSYRDFMERFKELATYKGSEFISSIEMCREPGQKIFLDEKTADGSIVHAMLKKIVDNPVTHVAAYVAVVLKITPRDDQRITYAELAQSLSSDYESLYYVDIDNDDFIEFSKEGAGNRLSIERHGEKFFDEVTKDVGTFIYEDDREDFYRVFTKEDILATLDDQGVFIYNYRLMIKEIPTYMSMKIVRVVGDDRHIIIGVSNVDTQIRQQETIERLTAEKTTFSRVSALVGDYIAIYSVDPDTGNYMEYSCSEAYSTIGAPKAGSDFFADSIENVQSVIHPDDLEHFLSVFTKEQILQRTAEGKVFKTTYRLLMDGVTERVSLRAGLVKEKDGPQLIIGVSRSDPEV
ncbi:MAG: EAL domain-containing protein [Eubacterium sp.]|nr:EAL domain-containing protein [Eubacterium sp.]